MMPNFIARRPFIILTIIYIVALALLDWVGFFSAPSQNDVSRFISDKYVSVKGLVVNVPALKNNKIQLIVKVSSVDEQKSGGKVSVTLFSDNSDIHQGDIIGFFTKLVSPPSARNPGAFDYAEYLRRNNIFAMAYISSYAKIGNIPLPFYKSAANTIRADIIDTLHRYLPQERSSVLIPMLIGEKSELSDDVKQAFQTAGLTHLLVVSGLNVAYVVIIFLGFFRLIGFKRRYAALLTIPFILLFMLIAGDNPPVVRATVMALFVIISLSLSREPLIYQSLAMAATTILLFDPQSLFSASFQLSFAATIGIVYLYPLFLKPFQNFPRWIQNSLGGTIAVSLAAQLAVLPIIAFYFNRVSLIGLISNIIVVPWTGIITALGIVLYLVHFISHFITSFIAYVTSFLLQWMLYLVHLFAKSPFATIDVVSPSLALIAGYYILLALIPLYSKVKVKIILCTAGAGIITLFSLAIIRAIPQDGPLTITSLYAGNGTAVHIEFPDKEHWLIDTGRERDGEKLLLPYLRSKGIRRIDKIIITSDAKHHYGGLKTVSDNLSVSGIIYPSAINQIGRYFISNSTITLVPVTSKKNGYILVCLDYAGRRIVFTHAGDLQYLPGEQTSDVIHISCHRNHRINSLRADNIILSGTAPEELPKTGKIYSLKQYGSVSVVITSGGTIRIKSFSEQ